MPRRPRPRGWHHAAGQLYRPEACPEKSSRIGLALAGGGPLGGIYEIGALCALEEALEGIVLTELEVYVGVSSGAFIASALANGISGREMYRIFIENASDEHRFTPEIFLKPAFREYFQRLRATPSLLVSAIWDYVRNPQQTGLMESLERLSRAIPTGILDNDIIAESLGRIFSAPGRTDDFRQLKHKLFIVATDLDTSQPVRFGAPGLDRVPISRAVQASAALPGLFPPVQIDGRHYVDGTLRKTVHASVALDQGCELVLCVNPLIPFDASLAPRQGQASRHKLVDGGLPMVLSQTFRALIHSRMQVGMSKYADLYAADLMLFEPSRDDAELFFANVFRYANRRRLCEHAYQSTRRDLLVRAGELRPILARHGIRLRADVLRDSHRHLAGHPLHGPGRRRRSPLSETVRQLTASLNELERWVLTQIR